MQAKLALVTGGAKGIGLAVTRALAERGVKVIVTGRDEAALAACSEKAYGITADFSDEQQVHTLIERCRAIAKEEGAPIQIIVNNAGVAISRPLPMASDKNWKLMMTVNAWAPFAIVRGLYTPMIDSGWGRIVNVASNAGLTGYQYTSIYCASKHAVIGYTRALALELATTGVTINAVCPGWVDTEMASRAVDMIAKTTNRTAAEARAELENMSPQKRMVTPQEVAHAVMCLCADEARGINGHATVLDGGQVLK